MFKIKIIYHLHGKGIAREASNNSIKRALYKFAFKNEEIIILSKLLHIDIKSVYFKTPFIVPNGINNEVKILKRKYSKYNEPLEVLFLSNLFISKGIMVFFVVLYLLKRFGLNYKATIIGAEGDLNITDIKNEIKNKNLEKYVIYKGAKYGKDKFEILKKTDLLIYPTLEDVWGNVNLEAMQFGIPVIASDEGAIPEIIDNGVTGFIVPKNNASKIVEKIILLSNDRSKLCNMGMAARKKFIENYTLDKFETNLKNVFSTVVK